MVFDYVIITSLQNMVYYKYMNLAEKLNHSVNLSPNVFFRLHAATCWYYCIWIHYLFYYLIVFLIVICRLFKMFLNWDVVSAVHLLNWLSMEVIFEPFKDKYSLSNNIISQNVVHAFLLEQLYFILIWNNSTLLESKQD